MPDENEIHRADAAEPGAAGEADRRGGEARGDQSPLLAKRGSHETSVSTEDGNA